MSEALRKLYSGDFNRMNQKRNSDGTKTVTLSKRGEGKTYKFIVKNLYKEGEEVLSEEVITHG